MSNEKQIEEMAKCCTYYHNGECCADATRICDCDLMCEMFGVFSNLENAGYRKIPTTDWLTKGVPQEQLEREADEAIKEIFERNCEKYGYRKQSVGENISQMHPSDEFICEKCGLIIRECCRYEIDEDDGDEICYEFPYKFCPRCGMKVKGGE